MTQIGDRTRKTKQSRVSRDRLHRERSRKTGEIKGQLICPEDWGAPGQMNPPFFNHPI
jgi:hypothetical protein